MLVHGDNAPVIVDDPICANTVVSRWREEKMRTIVVGMMLGSCDAGIGQDTPKKLTSADLSVETHNGIANNSNDNTMLLADTDEYRCMVFGANGFMSRVVQLISTIYSARNKKVVKRN